MASKSYDKIADICDDLILQVSTQGITFQDEWPYSIHLLGHIYIDDLTEGYMDFSRGTNLLQMVQRHFEEQKIEQLDVAELTQVQHQLDAILRQTRIKKSQLMMKAVTALHEKGGVSQPPRIPSQPHTQQGSSFTLQLFQRTLEETLGSFQKSIHEDIRNLHIEILRQFHMQEMEMSGVMSSILENQAEIMKEVQSQHCLSLSLSSILYHSPSA